jgi:hypothetical protein
MLDLSRLLSEKPVLPGGRGRGWPYPGDAAAALPPGLAQVVHRRLAIARIGLAEVSQYLLAGQTAEADLLLDKLDEDLSLLQRRLRREAGDGAAEGPLAARPRHPR